MTIAVIGIDPSLTGTGYAPAVGPCFTIHGKLGGDDRLMALWNVTTMQAEVADLAVIEDLPTHGMGAGKTGMAQGVIRLALLRMTVPYVTVTPATLKKFATGRGNATKADMRMELYKRAGVDLADDNEVDAYWLRQIGLARYDQGNIKLPAMHRQCLSKIDWKGAPEVAAA